MANDFFCIFAGGGVRGTSYLGVLKAFEEMDINLTGLAGASVGAIFATLCAVGYSYEEFKEVIFDIDFKKFKDFNISLPSNFTDFGLYKGTFIQQWIRTQVEKKYYGKSVEGLAPVRFRDLDKDLIIIATNLSYTCYKEYSKYTTPDMEIAQAVRASISIPGVFKPVWDGNECLIDGDFIKNFPLWALSKNMLYDHKRIIEFRLECSDLPKDISKPSEYVGALLDTSYNISTDILVNDYADNHQFDIIKIQTGNIKPTDFHIGNREKEALISTGIKATKTYFETSIIKKRKMLIKNYKHIKKETNRVYNLIQRNKVREANIHLADLAIYLADNKPFIHNKFYEPLVSTRKMFTDNVFLSKFFRSRALRKKGEILLKFEQSIKDLDTEIKELEKVCN